jgi:YegS/Rv2252/BmrU family lipid kinase
LSEKTKTYSSSEHSSELPLVIVNPTSAGGATGDVWAKTASDFSRHFGAFSVEFTKGRGDGKRIAFEAATKGRRFIIACGGDGTINEVANGILESGSEAELGILPSGTGGDFRRTLEIPAFSANAARYLKEGKTKIIDVGRVIYKNHLGESESRYFLGVASFGMSTSVIDHVKNEKPFDWLPFRSIAGRATFAWSTLQTTLKMKYTRAIIQIDEGRERELSLVNFVVANARFFGGGMKIAPDAKLDDGLFDVVMIGEISSAKILANSYKLYSGTHAGVAEVHQTRAKKIIVKPIGDGAVSFETDGELPGLLPATFEIVPGALQIRVPLKKI